MDELVVVANLPDSLPADLHGARVIENERPRSYAANLNAAFARTSGELIAVCNPDAVPEPDAVRILAEFMESTPALRHRRAADARPGRRRGSRRGGAFRP